MDLALQNYLESFLSEDRIERFKQVLQFRTRHVTIVLEDIYQSQNASAILRTCECLGVQDLFVIEQKHKFTINKQVVRGANKWMDVHKFNKHQNNTNRCLNQLKKAGYKLVVTVPDQHSTSLFEMDESVRTAFIFGTEKFGVSKTAMDLADEKITVPMFGFTESYNVSVSVAMCLFDFLKRAKKNNNSWQLSTLEKNELFHQWTKKAIKRSDLIIREFYTTRSGKIDLHI